MEGIIATLIAILLYSIYLNEMKKANKLLAEIVDTLKECQDSQESGNKQRQLGLTYLYAIAKRHVDGGLPVDSSSNTLPREPGAPPQQA